MLARKSIGAGILSAAIAGLTALAAMPALAHDHDHDHGGRGHWRPYYHEHHWVGPGYYWAGGSWVYYEAPFAYYPPYPPVVYAPPPAVYVPPASFNVVVPLRFR